MRPWNTPNATLPDEMWNMLQIRCPDLCELTVDLPRVCHHKFNTNPLIRCRWPKFHTLMVGDIWTFVGFAGWDLALAFFAIHGILDPWALNSETVSTFLVSVLTTVLQPTDMSILLLHDLQGYTSLTSLNIDMAYPWDYSS